MTLWKHGAKKTAVFVICSLKYQVLELFRHGLKTWRGLSTEVRSENMYKSFLVSACDTVRTTCTELHYSGEDDAETVVLSILS